MTIRKIIGEHGTLPKLCGNGNCPAAIIADDGSAYVQGYELNATERSGLTAPVGENFVRIPVAILQRIAAQVVQGPPA